MPISSRVTASGDHVSISVKGRFDFGEHVDFRHAYESHGDEVSHYTIDMKETEYLDSSALGMLLLLRDFAGGNDASIKIINCSDDVKKILSISNFEQLFEIG